MAPSSSMCRATRSWSPRAWTRTRRTSWSRKYLAWPQRQNRFVIVWDRVSDPVMRPERPQPFRVIQKTSGASHRPTGSPTRSHTVLHSPTPSHTVALYNHPFPRRPLPHSEIGIIGGSGLYSMAGLTKVKEVRLKTPFGKPSDAYVLGTLEGRRVAFLARHGRGHRILPTELNFRANIYGFKQLGVERIVSISAVGSLKEEHKPLEFVIPDQFLDRTRHRIDTFFGNGIVAHIAFADPICPQLAQ